MGGGLFRIIVGALCRRFGLEPRVFTCFFAAFLRVAGIDFIDFWGEGGEGGRGFRAAHFSQKPAWRPRGVRTCMHGRHRQTRQSCTKPQRRDCQAAVRPLPTRDVQWE